jgi:GNAT superfamily N-acetyltransferase
MSSSASAATPGVELRPATTADLPDCERIWREGLNGYLGPMGIPDVPLDNPGLRRLHAHTLATDPERFWVAERGGRVIAFGSAVERSALWFLSMLFVEPAEQGRRIGQSLLERMLPRPGDGHALATATDSAQPVSNGLYGSLGIVPRMPMFHLIGRPRPGSRPAELPDGIRGEVVGAGDTAFAAARDALDRELVGFVHPEDHAFAAGDRVLFAYRDRDGALAGYGYASEVGRIGPIAARDGALLGPILEHLLDAVEPRGASAVWLPGAAGEGVVSALRAGLRIEGFPTLLCWSRPFGDFERYVPISPGLI